MNFGFLGYLDVLYDDFEQMSEILRSILMFLIYISTKFLRLFLINDLLEIVSKF